MIENLNNIFYCSSRKNLNNVEEIIHLDVNKESNSIPFANINLLLNNMHNVETLLLLKLDVLEKILNTIPSQMRTLLSLVNFNQYLDESLILNSAGLNQYKLIKDFDYHAKSLVLNMMNDMTSVCYEHKQMAFTF